MKGTYRIFDGRSDKARFLVCPACNTCRGMTVKVFAHSVLKDVPVYCRVCRRQWMTDYKNGVETVSCEEE